MAEVAERGEPHAPVGEHEPRLPRVERAPRERVGPVGDGKARDQSAEHGQGRRRVDDDVPVEAAQAVDEVGERRAERERPDDGPERETAAALEPRGHQLERGRIHPCEEETGRDTQRNAGSRAAGDGEQRVRPGCAERPARITDRGENTSATLSRLDASAPATNPTCTAIVSHDAPVLDRLHTLRSCGTTADAENHVVIASTSESASTARAWFRSDIRLVSLA